MHNHCNDICWICDKKKNVSNRHNYLIMVNGKIIGGISTESMINIGDYIDFDGIRSVHDLGNIHYTDSTSAKIVKVGNPVEDSRS